jgi:hypothetical protein
VKVLHLSQHDGCLADFEYVSAQLGLEVESARFDDGYNIGAECADRAWTRWRPRIESSDAVLVSDTAPLARIVLQHLDAYRGHLVIWVCNRFDYADQATNDCGFPDAAYYDLFRRAVRHPRVHVASFTPFEPHYARRRKVELGERVIKPIGLRLPPAPDPLVPRAVDKPATVFVPPYHNDTRFLDLAARCEELGVPAYGGRYGGPEDLRDFRAIVHIPYSWSTFAFFEHLQNAVPMMVPSPRLLLRLSRRPNFFWPDRRRFRSELALAEWYRPEHDFLVRFRGWRDLGAKLHQLDLAPVRARMRVFAEEHTRSTLSAWAGVFGAVEAAHA